MMFVNTPEQLNFSSILLLFYKQTRQYHVPLEHLLFSFSVEYLLRKIVGFMNQPYQTRKQRNIQCYAGRS